MKQDRQRRHISRQETERKRINETDESEREMEITLSWFPLRRRRKKNVALPKDSWLTVVRREMRQRHSWVMIRNREEGKFLWKQETQRRDRCTEDTDHDRQTHEGKEAKERGRERREGGIRHREKGLKERKQTAKLMMQHDRLQHPLSQHNSSLSSYSSHFSRPPNTFFGRRKERVEHPPPLADPFFVFVFVDSRCILVGREKTAMQRKWKEAATIQGFLEWKGRDSKSSF